MPLSTFEYLAGGCFFLGILLAIIPLMRLFGAWMLRINEIIHLQEDILDELRKLNAKR